MLSLEILIGALFLVLHFALKWEEYRREQQRVGLWTYALHAVPAQSMIAIVGTVCAFVLVYSLDWLNPGMAAACGYCGSSIADNIATRFGAEAGVK